MIIHFVAIRLIYYDCLWRFDEAGYDSDPDIRLRDACVIVTLQQEEGIILPVRVDSVLVENGAPELDL
jgi:hypothetical protein